MNVTVKDNSLSLPVKLGENCVIDVRAYKCAGGSANGCERPGKASVDSLNIYHTFTEKQQVIFRQRRDETFIDPIIKPYQILRPCYQFHIRINVKNNKYHIDWVDRKEEANYDPVEVPISQVKYINVCGETKDTSITLQRA